MRLKRRKKATPKLAPQKTDEPKADKPKKKKNLKFKIKESKPKQKISSFIYPEYDLSGYRPIGTSDKVKVAQKVFDNFPDEVNMFDPKFKEWLTATIEDGGFYLNPESWTFINVQWVSARQDLLHISTGLTTRHISFPKEVMGYPSRKRAWYIKRYWKRIFEAAIQTDEEFQITVAKLAREASAREAKNKDFSHKNRGKKLPSYKMPKRLKFKKKTKTT